MSSRKARNLPLGCQDEGCCGFLLSVRRWTSPLPSTCCQYMFSVVLSDRLDVNTMRRPSGVQTGLWLSLASNVKRDTASRAQLALIATTVLLAAIGVLFASGAPDGLESLAGKAGIAGNATGLFASPLADYEWKGLGPEWTRKAGAGLAGIALIYGLSLLMVRARGRS